VLNQAASQSHGSWGVTYPQEAMHLPIPPAADFPDTPVLPETLLLLELQLQEPSVDLSAMSQLILGDLGATVQILRLAGREYGHAEDRPNRMEDCIADLGLEACLEAVSARTVTRGVRHGWLQETWAHSLQVAQYCKLIAQQMSDLNPEEAYIVGLLHSLGSLPSVLGWGWKESKIQDDYLGGFKLAKKWFLPDFLTTSLNDLHTNGCEMLWPNIMRTAHQLAMTSSTRSA
jgi:hypothetical protein